MPDALLKHGAVSRETVYEMARGAKAVAQADYALSISGIAGPGGGSAAKARRHGVVRVVHADRIAGRK